MVIRDLLDRLDREKENHVSALKRLDKLRKDILTTCREEIREAPKGRKGERCHEKPEVRAA